MGYIMMPDQTLILEGSICPDQVTNVSRDAMTAYVECQVNKSIHSFNRWMINFSLFTDYATNISRINHKETSNNVARNLQIS